ncbi:hypothetical protein R1flu_029087 [Riccia fluitans]|uniref:NAD(P)-binding domain-containing protein n=1 Tax=Riccia fluitans TaxID=41844 RepID=A0ABD1XP20_9MARC
MRAREGEMATPKELVCMTGAGGYVASYIVKRLLEKGYRVRGTVRDPANSTKTKHLRDLPGAEERLEQVGADLLVEGSFDVAVEGCVGVSTPPVPLYFLESILMSRWLSLPSKERSAF